MVRYRKNRPSAGGNFASSNPKNYNTMFQKILTTLARIIKILNRLLGRKPDRPTPAR